MGFDIEALKRRMLVKYPFFGSTIAGTMYKEDKRIKTASTDGKCIYYNPDFLNGLSLDQQVFVLAHEVCHIAFNHIMRREGKEHKLWNIATDAVINQFLLRDGLSGIDGIVDRKDAINYDADSYYELLLRERENKDNSNNSNDDSSNNSSDNSSNDNESGNGNGQDDDQKEKDDDESYGHDSHDMWDDAISRAKEEGKVDTSSVNEKDFFDENVKEKKRLIEKLKKDMAKDVAKASSGRGDTLGGFKDVGSASSLIDWRYYLKEATNYDVDWSYRNATIEDGVVTAKLEEKPFPVTEIVLDTSGSISEDLLRNFLRECKNIFKYSRLRVGCFDTQFYGFNDIRSEDDIEKMSFSGGGGTDFDVAVNAFSRRTENKIIFTDGCANMPSRSVNAIWIVFGMVKNEIKPLGGKVIYICGEQFRRLLDDNSRGKRR